ncbi:helix-turn-helix domain-containing protein [Sinomonas sp. JGH33]|uniref:Helix-turn-helix domain-containing protein n=1 Tax=Sinomonas terricola TaxID=3110330 RepID=A0ABU5T1Q2_9MICC|nr:helix-turn-helix domain-containing protein [Sinomonas sp. JGH33]MEA5453592.1 helix-turn-helix domain-containing protein [Sinomonas sp. JGH33]
MNTAENDRRPLRVEEAATLAGIGRGAMYTAVKDGTVPSLRIGRRVLIPRKAFFEWLDGDKAA